MRSKKDRKSNAFSAILIGSIMAVVLGAVMLYVGLFTTATLASNFGSTLTPTAATATLTMSGNFTCGEQVNITNTAGVMTTFQANMTYTATMTPYENTTCVKPISAYYEVLFPRDWNTSATFIQNISTAINANATIGDTMTAFGSGNIMRLDYDTTGTEGNKVILAETLANGVWSSSKLKDGVEGSPVWGNVKGNVNTGFVLLGIILIVGGAGGIIAVLMGFMGTAIGVGAGRRG